MDKASIEALAEAYWSQHVAPVMRRLTIDAFVNGHAALETAYADWLAAMPGNRVAAEPEAPVDRAPGGTEASVGEEVAAGPEAAGAHGPEASAKATDVAPGPAVPPPARPLKGLSAATYEIVMRAGRPLLSRDLLKELRKRDGGEPTPARDNTLLASMRRLRNAKVISWDGTYYGPMPDGASDASQQGADDPARE